MQGLQWYSMINSPKRNVIEMFHVAACSCTKWPVYGFTWHRVQKRYAWKALKGNQKIGTSWMQGLQWYSMRKLTKKKCNWNVSCGPKFMHKWLVMDLFGKGPKKYASQALMRKPKNWHKLNARSSMVLHEKTHQKEKCNWSVSCGPMFMHKMA